MARIGMDILGKQAIQNFQIDGINTEYIVEDNESVSGVALIFVDQKGENSIAVTPGSNSKLSIQDVNRVKRKIEDANVLLIQLEIHYPIDLTGNLFS